MNDGVRLTGGTNAAAVPVNTVLETCKRNFNQAVVLIQKLSANDEAFKYAFEGIKKRLAAEFTVRFPADIQEMDAVKETGSIVIKVPRHIFAENSSLEAAVHCLLKGFLKMVNARLDPTVKFDKLLEHLETQITQQVQAVVREKTDAAVLEILGTAPDTQATPQELAKASPVQSSATSPRRDPAMDDTAVEERARVPIQIRKAKPSEPETEVVEKSDTTDLRTDKQRNTEEKIGLRSKDYGPIIAAVLRLYTQSPNLNDAWKSFGEVLSKVNHSKELTANALEKIINIFFWRKLQDHKATVLSATDLKGLWQETQTALIINLRDYIIGTNPDDLAGQNANKVFLTEAIDAITPKNLLDELQDSNVLDLNQLQQAIRNISLDFKQRTSSNIPTSLGTIVAASTSEAKGLGYRQRFLTGETSKIDPKNINLMAIAIEPDFLELINVGEYHSTKGFAESLSSAITTDIKTAEDPFDGKIHEGLFSDFTNAIQRDREKKLEVMPEYLLPFKNLDELVEYFKTLANALNSCESLQETCSSTNISPTQYALPYILMNYLKTKPEFKEDCLQALEKLDSNNIKNFIGMKDTLNNLLNSFQKKEERKRLEQKQAELAKAKEWRENQYAVVVNEFAHSANSVNGRVFHLIGKNTENKYSRMNAGSFFMRLMLPNLTKDSTHQLLNYDQDIAIEEIFYLVTGNILLSPISGSSCKVFNSESNHLETLTRSELSAQYAKACRSLLSEFHPDNINRGSFMLTIIAKLLGPTTKTESQSKQSSNIELAARIGQQASSFIEDVGNLIQTGAGWQTEKFGNVIAHLRTELNQFKQTGFIPLLNDFASNPESSKRLAQKIIDTKAEQVESSQELTANIQEHKNAIAQLSNELEVTQEQQKKTIEHSSLIVKTLSSIWRSISGSMTNVEQVKNISNSLKQLSA